MPFTFARLTLLAPILCVLAAAQDAGSTQSNPAGSSAGAVVPSVILVRLQQGGRPVNLQYVRVRLMSTSGANLSEVVTNDRGEASLGATAPGNYEIRISSPELEDTAPEMVSLYPRESRRFVFKEVRLRPPLGTTAPGSAAAMVGVGELNIPENARQAFADGDSALTRQDFREARKSFEKAVRAYPQYAAAYNNLGAALMQLGEREKGRKAFEKAITLDAHLPGANLNLAKIVLSEQKLAEAEVLLLRSLTADPANPEALALVAYTQLGLGKLDDAIVNARKVHAIPHPRSALAHFIAARALEAKQRPDEAMAEYKVFLAEAPDSPNAARAQESLAALQARKP